MSQVAFANSVGPEGLNLIGATDKGCKGIQGEGDERGRHAKEVW